MALPAGELCTYISHQQRRLRMSGLYLNMDDFQNIDQAIDALDKAEVLYDPRGGTSGDNLVVVKFTCDSWGALEKFLRCAPDTDDLRQWMETKNA
tara:strand:+ start:66 stop:350 length:285 start_codon:yes stop_codon:yes gene_type:complete